MRPRLRNLVSIARRVAAGAGLLLLCAAHAPAVDAQEIAAGRRFYDQEPFDVVILNDAARTEVRTLPLDLPDRKLPKEPKRTDRLLLRRFETPDEEYEVFWGNIAEVKLFERMILDEARKLVAAGKFNEAFDYYEFMRGEYPRTEGLDEAIADFLYEEAKHWQRERRFENALALLHTLHARQPDRPGLEAAMGAATGRLIDGYLEAEDFGSARRLLHELKRRFPASTTAARYEQQLAEQAETWIAQGREHLAASRAQQAITMARRALEAWPTAAGARELAEEAFAAFPLVSIGVTSLAPDNDANPMVDWAARRTRRLRERRLFEFVGYGADGGEYISPYGSFEVTDLGRVLALNVAPDIPWTHGTSLTGYDVARRLLGLAQPEESDYEVDWADALATVEVRDGSVVTARFRRALLLPMALAAVSPYRRGDGPEPASIRPYVPQERSAEQVSYVVGDRYFRGVPTQPRGIIEQAYSTRSLAVEALRRGEVTAVDRLAPWEVPELRENPAVVVDRYSVPTIHVLVPNLSRPLMRHRAFRRALVYGIDRQRILRDQVLHRQELDGCQVISGPFARGAGLTDSLGYAYDEEIAPRPYEPRLALTLSSVAQRDLAIAAQEAGEETAAAPPAELPPLRLAHPADDVARAVSKGIVRSLGLVGIKVELREIPSGEPLRAAEDDDLLYVAMSIEEPLVDARRVFGAGGIVGSPSTYMSLALRRVEAATGWNEARQALHEVHRIAHDEVSVLPLFQIVEHFAYRPSLSGVSARPATLYQSVESWQAEVTLGEPDS